MLESWGHVVNLIDDEATQAEVDAAVAEEAQPALRFTLHPSAGMRCRSSVRRRYSWED